MAKRSIDYYGSMENVDEVKVQSKDTDTTTDKEAEQEYDPNKERVRISGPLSEVYTKALDIVYAKPGEVKNKLSVESQAIDATIMNAVAGSLNQIQETEMVDAKKEARMLKNMYNEPALYLYASNTKQLNSGELLDKIKDLKEDKDKHPEVRVAVVVDDVREGVSAATEDYETPRSTAAWLSVRKACKKANIELYDSMSAFAKHL